MTPRSHLYVPGDRPEMLAGALERGADALIADLEDAVPMAAKEAARQAVVAWLATVRPRDVEIWVRVNPGLLREADIRAVANDPALTGSVVVKAGRADLVEVDGLLTDLGSAARLVPLIETAAAVLEARDLAHAPRVLRLHLGEADLRADTGIDPGPDERELLWPRTQIVMAAAAAGIEPPVAAVSTEYRDLAAFRASTEAMARLGFLGRACIHPAQVAVVNEVFTPAPEAVERARELLARFAAEGSGVAVDPDGRMVDEAVVRQARRLLDRAR
jgi:citrate lyase subunit beta / citryl-CoA lyase